MWDDCIRSGIFTTPELERFFGPAPEGQKDPPGKANYAQCVKRGIGRKVFFKMLAGAESAEDIRKVIDNFPMTERRRRYEAEQAEQERLKTGAFLPVPLEGASAAEIIQKSYSSPACRITFPTDQYLYNS